MLSDQGEMLGTPDDTPGPYSDPPRGLWRLVRGVWVVTCGWIILATGLALATGLSLLTLRVGVDRWYPPVVRLIARAMLRLAGVRIRVVNRERLGGRSARLVCINHASQLDMFVIGALMPDGSTAIAKRELLWVPFLGWAFFAFRFITVDRRDSAAARVSLEAAAQRLRERRATVMIAPEGTRSRDGSLGPFKMGLFHLAKASAAPIIPAVVRGARACHPMGQWLPDPGLVEVEFLAPIDTSDFTDANLKQKRDELRELYLAQLSGSVESAAE